MLATGKCVGVVTWTDADAVEVTSDYSFCQNSLVNLRISGTASDPNEYSATDEDPDEGLFTLEYSHPNGSLRIRSEDYAFVQSSPNIVYVAAWLRDSYEPADLYYTSTFS